MHAAKDVGVVFVVEVDAVGDQLLEMLEIAKSRHVVFAQHPKEELVVSKGRAHHANDVPEFRMAKADAARGAAAHRNTGHRAPGEAAAVGMCGDRGVVAGQQALGGAKDDGRGRFWFVGRRRRAANRNDDDDDAGSGSPQAHRCMAHRSSRLARTVEPQGRGRRRDVNGGRGSSSAGR